MNEIDQFNTLRNTIIKSVVREIYKNYKIQDSNNNLVPKEQLISIFIDKKKCIGVINSQRGVSQCKKNAIYDNDYCEKHYKNNYKDYCKEDCDITTEEYTESSEETEMENEYIQKLKKKLIKDTFYYVDYKYNFIYNLDCKKVGIIRDSNFILTDNPMILQNLF
jgi:hypothetical protein